ncbi:PAS domain S-box-containing protein [Dyadobacter soli]|uniref:histidine kinase n=1 Tax=Dyadobacter soli TaxID=659014 RepID=A0A1G6UW11_9BACT|nr:PAS domain-containing sensor histidine kinase [Dyadobacter soli]SDD44775.1 PAS domain S-box-containing protein [Dyadobacter soli]
MHLNSNLIFHNLADGVFLLDETGRITNCNAAASAITGFEESEIEGKPFYTIGDGQDDPIKYRYELDQARKKNKFVAEGWKLRKDRTRYWAETSYSPVYDESEQLAGFCVLVRDISEQKERQSDLLESEERYRLMVEAVRDYSIFMLDPEGNVLTWNDGGMLIHGYAESEILGKHFSIFYPSADQLDEKPKKKLHVARDEGSYREEGWRVKKDGSLFWASVVLTALFNDRNALIGYSKVTSDLTGRLKDEEVLRQSEARYRSLVEQVGDYGIFMLDTKGRIISWNEGARRIKGYSAEDVIGKYFSIFYPEEDIINGKPAWELKVARATGKYEEEGWRLRKDGSRFWANIVITAVYDTEGRLSGFSKVTRDLTERKMSEQALQESSDKYRQLVAELSVTNSELSSVNRELEQFTAIVSHDLKEPVRTVRSFLHLMDQHVGQQKFDLLKSSIGKGVLAAQRMHDLIDNLLHYSQISKIGLQRQKLRVEEVIGEAIQNLNDAVEQSGAQIRVESDVSFIYGDRVQLVQLFQNLLANALKFTNGNSPEVTVKSWMENGNVRFVVEDNGIGISPDHLEKIFEIFRRLHFAHQYPGYGVGLAVCKKVVERHRGTIWAESVQGKGASFHILLPKI